MLGSGGKVSLGIEGIVGNGGTLPWGNVGIEGKGGNVVGIEGNVGFGKLGILGKFGCVLVCKRFLASRLMLKLDKVTKRTKDVMKFFIEAIVWWIAGANQSVYMFIVERVFDLRFYEISKYLVWSYIEYEF
jgi:hypothetical protein